MRIPYLENSAQLTGESDACVTPTGCMCNLPMKCWSKCVSLGGGKFKAAFNMDFACEISESSARKEIFSNHTMLTYFQMRIFQSSLRQGKR
jgi:hypothetical protein